MGRAIDPSERGKVVEFPMVGGLHHHYRRQAAGRCRWCWISEISRRRGSHLQPPAVPRVQRHDTLSSGRPAHDALL